jgi:hypothetical protein
MASSNVNVRWGRRQRSRPSPIRKLSPVGESCRVLGSRQDVPGPAEDLVQILHPREPSRQQVLGLPEQHKVLFITFHLAKGFPIYPDTIVQINPPDIPRAATVSFCFKRGYNPPESPPSKRQRTDSVHPDPDSDTNR